jgi:REP element-mobilizing transposase RayT
MNRGAGKKHIFRNNAQRAIFLELLDECYKMFNVEIHAYCLMDNHYHLLINTPNANLSRIMRHLNSVYTQRYNRMMKTDGPLFRGRYKAQLVDGDKYLLLVSRYIHLNPVEARLVNKPADYKWSSYPVYIGMKRPPAWLTIKIILGMIKNTKFLSHISYYRDYVESRDLEEINVFASSKIAAPIFGSKNFVENITSQIDSKMVHACAADMNRIKSIPDIELIIIKICAFYKIDSMSLLVTKRGSLNWPRLVFMYVSRKLFGHELKAISQSLNCSDRSTVSAGVQKCTQRLLADVALRDEIATIYQDIKMK